MELLFIHNSLFILSSKKHAFFWMNLGSFFESYVCIIFNSTLDIFCVRTFIPLKYEFIIKYLDLGGTKEHKYVFIVVWYCSYYLL